MTKAKGRRQDLRAVGAEDWHILQKWNYNSLENQMPQVMKYLTTSPTRAKKYSTAYKKSSERETPQLSPVHALSMHVETGLSWI